MINASVSAALVLAAPAVLTSTKTRELFVDETVKKILANCVLTNLRAVPDDIFVIIVTHMTP